VRGASLGLALLACLGAAAAAAGPLELRIRNDTTAPLRCVLVLAHWYSEELAPVAPGGTGSLALESGSPDGMVIRRNDRGHAMAVEGFYCLTGKPGAALRAAVSIETLRKATGTLPIACRDTPDAACAIGTP
jgi:hypothetical protein